jgi:hypothetical protein
VAQVVTVDLEGNWLVGLDRETRDVVAVNDVVSAWGALAASQRLPGNPQCA